MARATCGRCKGALPPNARRCMRCGAQVFVAPTVDAQQAQRDERERLLRRYALSEMQIQILSAASGSLEIFVCGTGKVGEGEVKSGDQRFYGNEAVMAVAALAGPGLIAPQGEDCFRVTADGTKVIKALDGPATLRPAPVPGR